jgi:hypothetical protein
MSCDLRLDTSDTEASRGQLLAVIETLESELRHVICAITQHPSAPHEVIGSEEIRLFLSEA